MMYTEELDTVCVIDARSRLHYHHHLVVAVYIPQTQSTSEFFSWVYRLPFYEYMYINVCVA